VNGRRPRVLRRLAGWFESNSAEFRYRQGSDAESRGNARSPSLCKKTKPLTHSPLRICKTTNYVAIFYMCNTFFTIFAISLLYSKDLLSHLHTVTPLLFLERLSGSMTPDFTECATWSNRAARL
jgi:hypothetical protein